MGCRGYFGLIFHVFCRRGGLKLYAWRFLSVFCSPSRIAQSISYILGSNVSVHRTAHMDSRWRPRRGGLYQARLDVGPCALYGGTPCSDSSFLVMPLRSIIGIGGRIGGIYSGFSIAWKIRKIIFHTVENVGHTLAYFVYGMRLV